MEYPKWQSNLTNQTKAFIPNAYPGFNNTNLPNVTNLVVLPPDPANFTEMLAIASNYSDPNLRMVMITSWNEWLEATAIEPSLEYGEDFLKMIPEFPSFLIPQCL